MWPVCSLTKRLLKVALLRAWDNLSGKGSEWEKGMEVKNLEENCKLAESRIKKKESAAEKEVDLVLGNSLN